MLSPSRKGMTVIYAVYTALIFSTICSANPLTPDSEMLFVQVAARTKQQRTAIVNEGMSIEAIRSDSVWGFATLKTLKKLRSAGYSILGQFDLDVSRGGHGIALDFPAGDARFHNYIETVQSLLELEKSHPDIAKVHSIGKSIENRDIYALHINSTPGAREKGISGKPGVAFMGNHHAREHLSLEIPLLLAEYLLAHRDDANIRPLLEQRDIWIIPMVNPDGVEWDIAGPNYRYWRKNRRDNGNGTSGVDLNRNYGFKWGTGGSSSDSSSDVYMGKSPFSEPETQSIRDFISTHLNIKILLTFHTFSELILYPWGHKYDSIENAKDLATFERMAQTMAGWNRYKPQQSSDLYIASGDTTDWAYGEHGIFAFTFELSPKSMFQGGFYPGAGVIDKVFQDNLKPCLYLMDLADDPHRVLETHPTGGLSYYLEPKFQAQWVWDTIPFQF